MKTYIKPTTDSFALSMEQQILNTSANGSTGKSDLSGTSYDSGTMTIGARRQNDVWGPEEEEEEDER